MKGGCLPLFRTSLLSTPTAGAPRNAPKDTCTGQTAPKTDSSLYKTPEKASHLSLNQLLYRLDVQRHLAQPVPRRIKAPFFLQKSALVQAKPIKAQHQACTTSKKSSFFPLEIHLAYRPIAKVTHAQPVHTDVSKLQQLHSLLIGDFFFRTFVYSQRKKETLRCQIKKF